MEDPPPPAASARLREALRRHFGYPAFRAGQESLVHAVLSGRDALGVLPTGGGKSVCFQLPAFLLSGLVLVVSRLIYLMEDQTGRARKVGLRADFLSSATPGEDRTRVMDQARAGEIDLLLVAPERFQVSAFRRLLPELPVSLLAVDEAHCISHWGHDFRPSYLRIGEIRSLMDVPVLALTATATPRVREEMEAYLSLQNPLRVIGDFDRPNLSWEVRRVPSHGKKLREILALLRTREGASIIYAATRRSVEAVRARLAATGLPALSYHAGLSPERRTEVQARFLGDPRPVVVATNAFGMGIDRSDVRLVIHYQLSGSLEGYYQEAGRAGRDGNRARCVALHSARDVRVHQAFLAAAHPPEGTLRGLLQWLRRNLPTDELHPIPFPELLAVLGKGIGREGVLSALRSLEKAGAVALEGEVAISVLEGAADFRCHRVLKKAAEDQLVAVERYARGGRCRRKLILAYFGQAVEPGSCGRCDWCCLSFDGRLRQRVRGLLGL